MAKTANRDANANSVGLTQKRRRLRGEVVVPPRMFLGHDGHPLSLWWLAALPCILVVLISYLAFQHFETAFLVVLVATCGATGGVIFAMRESLLAWPRLERRNLNLGCIADCIFGVGGAFGLFLLIPEMSENMALGIKTIFGSTEKTSGMDIIEIIAMSLVGGFAGRAIMVKAANSVMHSDMAKIEDKIDQAEINSEVLGLVAQQVNRTLPCPAEEVLVEKVLQASNYVRARIFHAASTELQRADDQEEAARRTAPIFKALIEADKGEDFHQSRYMLAYAYSCLRDWRAALATILEAIRIRNRQNAVGFQDYEDLLAKCESEVDPNDWRSDVSPPTTALAKPK